MQSRDTRPDAETNPFNELWPQILSAHKEHFVQPFIRRHLSTELHDFVPKLLHLIISTKIRMSELQEQYGLADYFLNSKINSKYELDQLRSLLDSVAEVLQSRLFADDILISDQWTGSTKGNRRQVELVDFVVSLANLMKSVDGIPWGKVQLAISLLAKKDPRLAKAAKLYISNGESGKQALRSLYNRSIGTQAAPRESNLSTLEKTSSCDI